MGQLVVSAASLVLAFCGLVVIVAGLRRKTDEARTDDLEKDMIAVKQELNQCKRARREMQELLTGERDRNYRLALENYELLKRTGGRDS